MVFTLPQLPYKYDALEPFIDARTMEIHYAKHHQAYVDKLNKALEGYSELQKMKIEDLMKSLEKVPENIRAAVRNNGGGHINHSFFWPLLKKSVTINGDIQEAIKKRWGTFDKFKAEFSNAALNLFGSGWAWLVPNNGSLEIMTTQNQDTPLSAGKTPILGLDVWEHAYYLKYQNRRAEYIDAFFNVINWDIVNEHYASAVKIKQVTR